MDPDTISSVEVCRETGATYRQLDYWSRNHVIEPVAHAGGSGYKRVWHPEQLPVIRAITALANMGCPQPILRRVARELEEHPLWSTTRIVVDNEGVIRDYDSGGGLAGWFLDLPALLDTRPERPTGHPLGRSPVLPEPDPWWRHGGTRPSLVA